MAKRHSAAQPSMTAVPFVAYELNIGEYGQFGVIKPLIYERISAIMSISDT